MPITTLPLTKSQPLKTIPKSDFKREHTEEAIRNRSEVFTPELLVDEMLDWLPLGCFTSAIKTMLDPSCGNGNFLVKILERRMKNGIPHLAALQTIYGIEIDKANADECRERLALGSTDKAIWAVLNHNIICADALNPKHPGWHDVGYMWNERQVKHRKEIEAFFEP